MKLDLACGNNKQEGFFGVDYVKTPQVDQVVDLLKFPWPFAANSVEAVHCSHFVEHIPHQLGRSPQDGFFQFFDEVYRVCRHDAVIDIIHPYVQNARAFWDPTHRRFIHSTTWYYLDKEWRKAQGLDHYLVNADFEVVVVNGVGVSDQVALKAQPAQQFAMESYWNVIADLHVNLRARKAPPKLTRQRRTPAKRTPAKRAPAKR